MSSELFKSLIEELKGKLQNIIPQDIGIAILDLNGNYYYFDSQLEKFKDIINEIYKNLNINIGQYSLPLSEPLGIFRISENTLLVVYLKEGQPGNVLLFQGIINNYAPRIQKFIDSLQRKKEFEKKAFKVIRLRKKSKPKSPEEIQYPLLKDEFKNKRFSYEEGLVLKMCDGKHSISDIINSIKLSRIQIISIINDYQQKGWIKILTESEQMGGAEIKTPKISGEYTATSQAGESKIDYNSLYPSIFPKYMNKKFPFEDGQIIQYCDGEKSIKEIAELLNKPISSVIDVIDKYKSKGWLEIKSK